jgi:hypothetical protein
MKTKLYFAEQVILLLQNDYPNIDTKIDERQVLLIIDQAVNELAKKNYFENWKMGSGAMFDEQFITTWDSVDVVDQANSLPSYFIFPSNYVGVGSNEGIVDIVPIKFKTANQSAVIVTTFSDYYRYKSNPAGNMQGRLTGYPRGSKFEFTTCNVKKTYGNMIVRLAIRDSSMIPNDQPYPIPADKEGEVIATAVALFRDRRQQPTDTIRDNKDQGS